MAETKKIEVIIGKKEGSATKEGHVDKAPQKSEVGGRWHNTVGECPHCGAMNFIRESDVSYYWYTCWNCGEKFYA